MPFKTFNYFVDIGFHRDDMIMENEAIPMTASFFHCTYHTSGKYNEMAVEYF